VTEESQNEEGRFLDLDKYEGHTEGSWEGILSGYFTIEKLDKTDKVLMQDAPLLLEEVKRLQKKIDKANEAMLSAKRLLKYHYDIFCNFTHTTDLQDEAILDAVQALSDASE
jgi:hypothetical protein